MKKEVVKIEYPISIQILLKLGGIGLLVVGIFISKFAWKLEYLQIVPLIFGLLFLAFGLLCLSEGFNSIIIDSEGIIQKNLIRTIRIPKNQVKGYAEITYKSAKQKKTTQLFIFENQRKRQIKCDKESYGDKYELLVKSIKSQYKKVGVEDISKIYKQKENLYKNIGKGFGILVFVCGLYQLIFVEIIPREKFQQLTGTVNKKPIIEAKRKGRIESATYQFDEYSEYKFKVTGEHFRLLNPKAKKLNIGTNVKMKILKTEYQAKIEKEVSPDFANRYINWGVINLYEISHNGEILLNVKDINNSRGNLIPKFLIMLFGITIFIYYKYINKGYD